MFKKIVWLGFSTKWRWAKNISEYIKSLVDGGADEFFTGYNPPYWHEKFGFEVSPNGRFAEHEQITDLEVLKNIVSEVHKYGLEVFLNLNAWYYTDETFPYIERMYEEINNLWIDWIICWNIGILEYLKNKWFKCKINISTILALYNSEAIRFFLENYEVNKIILSREITLEEIEELLNEFPETRFEVFGEWDFCRYNNGLCFAEHKYWTRDICTVVVNDLIIKKKFRADYKKIILDENLSNEEKTQKLDDEYLSPFQEIEEIFDEIELYNSRDFQLEDDVIYKLNHKLQEIIKKNKDNVNLYFDAQKPFNDFHNKNIIIFLKGVKYLLDYNHLRDVENNCNHFLKDKEILSELKEELEKSIKTGLEYYLSEVKKLGGKTKMKAKELTNFYNKSDNLNLYAYLFLSKFKNLDTVKFPTRWRNYNEKLELIKEVLKSEKVDKSLIDRGISIERTHYDLSYIFGDKKWFREILQSI